MSQSACSVTVASNAMTAPNGAVGFRLAIQAFGSLPMAGEG